MTCNGPTSEDPAQELAQLDSRRETFANFPSHCPVSPLALAQAGFFYTGEGDKVRCFSCLATLEGWKQGDSVVGRHKDISPNCQFINDVSFEQHHLLSVVPNGPPGRETCFAATSVPPDLDLSPDFEADYLLRTRQVVDLSGSPYPQNPVMCNEEIRLRSFHCWPPYAPVTPKELANAGLYYRGVDDEVECFCCGGKMKNWEPGDQAWSEHRRHFPRCFFVLGHDVGNVGTVPNQSGDAQLERNNAHRVHLHKPSMADFANRLKTFVAWNSLVSKERLAQAGFYSLGTGDSVECFSCGGGLKEWKAGEDPWEEHARWYPGCKYLGEEKGQAFVNSVHLNPLPQESAIDESEKVLTIEDLSTEEKLKRLEEEKICKICMDKPISVVLIPCGHLLACQDCAEVVEKCPWCCKIIENRQKIFMP
ncbi:E3 ubiquitin-protein ligase XIAP isoform X2 [Candoia aspera]|uniref:E3 ubiquitin-protein ligase XIAP isoform X2 n=1 Tax=Candoia aspera TaxID=51853 RepID=UPI002FD7ADFF